MKELKRLTCMKKYEKDLHEKLKNSYIFEANAEDNWKEKYIHDEKNNKKYFTYNISISLYEWKTTFRPCFSYVKSFIISIFSVNINMK